MNYSSIPLAQAVVHHCKVKGIRNIVISPGSRNAPLILGFSEDSFFKCFSIVDERCAGFFALGLAQQLQSPVALVCTSGSALLNYYPAVAEAFYSDIPLLILSADRPGYKIDIGDGQTIRQDGVFDRNIALSVHLKQDVSHATERIKRYQKELLADFSLEELQNEIQNENDSLLNQAFNKALEDRAPVHVNIPFEEPLYDQIATPSVVPVVTFPEEVGQVEIPDLEDYANIWNTASKKLVLIGVNHPNTVEQQFLDELAEDPSVIVMTETTSNLHHPNFFPSIDSIIAPLEKSSDKEELFQKLQPDVLLTFGGLLVSKKIKAFLRLYAPKHHWHIDTKKAYDTFFCLSHHFKITPNSFFNRFLSLLQTVESNYFTYWNRVRDAYELERVKYIAEIPFSDMKAFHNIIAKIPEQYQLQLANSSTVRYVQLFDLKSSIRVFCNRGTSGIDGSTSTAIGASLYDKEPTLLLTGDLSFFYDSNGLWNSYIRSDFRVILINNGGGGIFRILPANKKAENFETYFETTHHLDAEQLCKMYNLEYISVREDEELTRVQSNFYEKSERAKLLEIFTPRLVNNKILLNYFDFIS
ncbi:2-succinyl-5-enolpyruvyl-6-hydroxy-3-cyclohexene-1-carboxylic-acid synthase [Spongiimicrobium salis]|uniref:2-succinyl-5-enolpyruvyl-6-hydroxy-3- cyclohexene-1-carboxylic-acid synthase n=1 Tax=Spongiimicrobium salis TaxID=1667022 RepID=UPI00374D1136